MRVSQLVGTLGPVNHSRLHQGCTKRVTAKQTITEGTDTKIGTEGKQFVVDVATLLKTNKLQKTISKPVQTRSNVLLLLLFNAQSTL